MRPASAPREGIEAVVPGKLFFQCFGIGGKLPGVRVFQQRDYGFVDVSSGTCMVAGSL